MANIQVRDVPEDVHRRLKSQAALAGQSLNEYLHARLAEIAGTPTVSEFIERLRREQPPYTGPSATDLIRERRGEL